MKKLLTVILIVLSILLSSQLNVISADNDYEIELPDRLNILENNTTFEVKLNSNINKDEVIQVIFEKEIDVTLVDKSTIKVKVDADSTCFTATNKVITFTVSHDDFNGSVVDFDFDIHFKKVKNSQTIIPTTSETVNKDKTTTERKTLYTYSEVNSWDVDNYSIDKPAGPFKELTQYAYEEAIFDDSNYSTSMPSDGIYIEKTMYGYMERSKEEVKTPYTKEEINNYNATGACPLTCDAGTEYFYGTGCSCRITKKVTKYSTSYNYGEWIDVSNSYRFKEAYEESDTVKPTTKTVYLIPISYSSLNNWTFEPLSSTSSSRVVTRSVYVSPLTFSDESEPTETVPIESSERIIQSREYCRIVKNGIPGKWNICSK